MKKNFLIMMIMVLCAGFTFAQNTVRGFVPGAATGAGDNQTYVVFGQMFGDIDQNAANPYEVAEGLAQAQIVADTVVAVVGCGDSLTIGDFTLTAADVQKIVDEFAAAPSRSRDTFLTIQRPNAAIFNYDQLLVLHLFVCPCTVNDADNHPYDVIAIDNLHCWTKSSLRATKTIAGTAVETMSYTSDIVSSLDEATFGLLYNWENASKGSKCDSVHKIGVCPDGWHLPTAAEAAHILNKNTDDLRTAEGNHWVVAENITNLTKFSAQPSGYYKGLAERFEGYHSEADFWYADNDSNCVANYFQILYYCNVPKQEYRSVDTDAMSVRCVLDMIYNYDNNNPTPTPIPTPPTTTDCPTIGTVSNVGDLGYYFAVNNYDASKISNVTVHYEAVYGVPTNAEQTVTLQGDASVNDQTVYFDNADNNPQYGWFYNEGKALENNPGVSIVDMALVAINTTATILYDGQICTGSDSKDISVELPVQPSEPGFIPTCFVNEIIASQTPDVFGVSGTLSGYSQADPTYNINPYVIILVKGVSAAEETVLQSDAQVAGDGSFSWSSNEYNLEYLHTTYPNGLTITISYIEGDSCPDAKSTTVTLW